MLLAEQTPLEGFGKLVIMEEILMQQAGSP